MLNLENISFKYNKGKSLILDDISLKIEDRSFTVIVGSNGSGKTTLSRIIAGSIKPTSGRYLLDNELITSDNYHLINSKIGYVFQNPEETFLTSNVEEEIAIGLEFGSKEKVDIYNIINKTSSELGISNLLSRNVNDISGGQMQKVAFASQMVLDKEVMVLDEPFSMLDVKSKHEYWNFIMKNKVDKTYILITHDLTFSLFASNIIVMKEGKILKQGKPSDILLDRELLLSANLLIPQSLQMLIDKKGISKIKNLLNKGDESKYLEEIENYES
ncbi:MAG: ATP-binding cassette domain-containing protein [Mycoplasmataceae bacterium]|nr:ATP-binding cassette domain-containing protein [Mycoplasmataceae bacterium]